MSSSPAPNLYQRILLLLKKTMKKKKKQSPQQSDLISSLPDELLLTCVARLSRLYYPTLSLVCSKRIQSLLASPELYKTRSLLGLTESCLYVCLRFPPDPNTRWYTLSRKPDNADKKKKNKKTEKNKDKEKSSGNILVPVSIKNSPPEEWSSLVAVGPYIYAISGSIEYAPCSNVPFLDCRTHTWLEAPRLRLAHTNISKFDGLMYLPGECENPESLNCIEVFNTETQAWKPVPSERREFNDDTMEGKFIVEHVNKSPGETGLAYKPKETTIEYLRSNTHFNRDCCCVVENVIYVYMQDIGEFDWYDDIDGSDIPRKLQGLEGLPKFSDDCKNVLLAEHGGKMVVLWDEYGGKKEKMIWCAEISFDKRSNGEIWGNVEWCNVVLTVPKAYKFVHALAATV